jgi:nicotinic acetylcholine receptor
LYDDLLSNYNRLIRPVVNNTETLTVWIGLKITQIIEESLRNQVKFGINKTTCYFNEFHTFQVMTTNLWVKQKWYDYKLKWDPEV